VPLPETIAVRYTEEEAGYVTVRPLVRQTFRLDELLDMILSVAGKDAARVRQLLRSGTIVYHFFRYSWAGFDASETELAAALARFPDADPTRLFPPGQCTLAIMESGGISPRPLMELDRAAGSKRRIFRGRSFWDRLLEIAAEENLTYQNYSYGRRADLYRLNLDAENIARIEEAANRLATGKLRSALRVLPGAASILFVCPQPSSASQSSARA
jgi:predicted DNA-binding ribbon-helix-helix protein